MSSKIVAPRELRIISSAELKRLVPFSPVHIWRLEQAGRFPKRIKVGEHRVGWDLEEIVVWIEARKSLRGP
ncbi:helix-turn-helix transcriptional regulator [Bradyrhizobium japonicum]|uniref:helix-turn-helix transcriptional regulator n=1 Tax=Bradyrhizobium japonicum TaxID=375 RepID=UPI003D9B1BAB